MEHTFAKNERLTHYAHISELFSEGKSLKNFPLKVLYLPIQTNCATPIKVLVSVPKRSFKQAVVRNYLKRIIRESYRLQKQQFFIQGKQFAMAFIYMSKEKIKYQELFLAMKMLSEQWKEEILGKEEVL